LNIVWKLDQTIASDGVEKNRGILIVVYKPAILNGIILHDLE